MTKIAGVNATRLLVALAAAFIAAVPAQASHAPWEPTPGGWVSGPVDYVTTVPIDAAGGVSGTPLDGKLYVTTFRSFSIYDVTDPLSPQLLSTVPLPGQLYNEQPDTNGKIAILTSDMPRRALQVWDVSDARAPVQVASLDLPKPDHMWTCVLACAYAYGGRGTIVDLAKPAAPEIVGDWTSGLAIQTFHSIEEVAPGRVLTGTVPAYLLDGRSRPADPKVRAAIDVSTGPRRLLGVTESPSAPPAFVDWPENATERYALVSIETPFSGSCNEVSGGFATYDTTGSSKTRTFRFVDDYRIADNDGTYTNGRAPHKAFGCSAYAFDAAPSYESSKRVAVAWFEDGMRLFEIGRDGQIHEVGGFIPIAGSTSSPVWLSDEVLYLIDINRGIDILRVATKA